MRKDYLMDEVRKNFEMVSENYKLNIIHEDGPGRIVTCYLHKQPDCSFGLVTHPNCLVFTQGPHELLFATGCVDDIFDFFRGESPDSAIWTRVVGTKVSERFDERVFRSHLTTRFARWLDVEVLPYDLMRRLDEEVIDLGMFGGRIAIAAAKSFEVNGKYPFHGIQEHDCHAYTWRFLWACHAIPWAIAQYDKAKAFASS